MKTAVRFFSKLGNTEKIAKAIAKGAGVSAVSIVDEPTLTEKVDTLFLGGAPYANIMAPELRKYAKGIKPEMVGKVVLFTTSNWSRRTVMALKKMLRRQGVTVEDKYLYAHMLKINEKMEAAEMFGRRMS